MELYKDLYTKQQEEKRATKTADIFGTVLVLLCIFLLFTKYAWFLPVQVEGDSMNATLNTGDQLLVDRLCDVDRGDVIVFTLNGKAYIKRVVGVEGDTVTFINGELFVKRAGEQEFKKAVYEGVIGNTYPKKSTATGEGFLVSKGCVFVLGDNRENSTDSRTLGEINLNDVNGVVHQFIIDHKDGFLGKLYKWL
ncbi:MAG: signal peptidase I [Clostridia bacterium]|nr:signal peptidase I [Clostridia bacterium]